MFGAGTTVPWAGAGAGVEDWVTDSPFLCSVCSLWLVDMVTDMDAWSFGTGRRGSEKEAAWKCSIAWGKANTTGTEAGVIHAVLWYYGIKLNA